MKFTVYITKVVHQSASVEVEAESKDEAIELAWEQEDTMRWREKVYDSDTYASEVKS